MATLKLAKLPDRKPVKISITVSPELHASLQAYAETYRATYGDSEEVRELIPYMIEQFLATDRGFAQAKRGGVQFANERRARGASEIANFQRQQQGETNGYYRHIHTHEGRRLERYDPDFNHRREGEIRAQRQPRK